jgi:hypothetical protein
MIMKKLLVLTAVILCLTFAAHPSHADDVEINSVAVDFVAGTITIVGEGFSPDGIDPEVTLAGGSPLGFDLDIEMATDTEIVASLPGEIEDGDYLLEVTTFEDDDGDIEEEDDEEYGLTIQRGAWRPEEVSCPAFTAAMVDAAWLATNFRSDVPAEITASISTEPDPPRISCEYDDRGRRQFSVRAGGGSARVAAVFDEFTGTRSVIVSTLEFPITSAEAAACRRQVLQSFVWNRICAPVLP